LKSSTLPKGVSRDVPYELENIDKTPVSKSNTAKQEKEVPISSIPVLSPSKKTKSKLSSKLIRYKNYRFEQI
jgi:hypothetical protein